MNLWNYGLQTSWLEKYLESYVPEYPPKVNMLKCAKHWWIMYDTTFVIFFHHYQKIELPRFHS